MSAQSEPAAREEAARRRRVAGCSTRLSASQVETIVGLLSAQRGGLRSTQRRDVRSAVLCPVLVWSVTDDPISEPIHAQLINLSAGGVGLLCGMTIAPYERIVIEMILKDVGHIQWKCSVRWCEESADGIRRIGAQLVDTTPHINSVGFPAGS